MTNTTPSLELDAITFLHGKRRILNGASIRLMPGRIHALLGRNGEGKSTMLNVAAGILRPHSGYLRVYGEVFERTTHAGQAMRGVYFWTDQHSVPPHMRTGDAVRSISKRFASASPAVRALDDVNVQRFGQSRLRDLSGGERRHAELAVAVARRPSILLADEPLRGLSPTDRSTVAAVIQQLAQLHNTAVLVTGHDATDLLDMADDVTLLHSTRTTFLGPAVSAHRHELLRSSYLGLR